MIISSVHTMRQEKKGHDISYECIKPDNNFRLFLNNTDHNKNRLSKE